MLSRAAERPQRVRMIKANHNTGRKKARGHPRRVRNKYTNLRCSRLAVSRRRKHERRPYLQQLCNLHRVQCCAFEQLIARHPKGKSVFKRAIKSHATHLTIIISRHAERHRITIALRFVHEFQARRFGQNFARLLN